jgi:transposase
MEYYGVDVHKRYSVFACVDEQGRVVRRGRVPNSPEALAAIAAPSGGLAKAVIESTGNWSYVHDELAPWVEEVVLAHSLRVKAIASAKVKTDRVDAETLAQLLRGGLIPAAYCPPPAVRDRRDWLRSRMAVVRMGTQLKNRVHALVAKSGFASELTDTFGPAGRAWLAGLPLRPAHRQIVDRYLALLDAVEADVRATTAAIAAEATADPDARLLMTVPGVGPLTALLFLAEVGDVHRFPDARHLVSYAGLAPRVRASGDRTRLGSITKQGSPWLRWVFAEAAARLGSRPGPFGDFYTGVRLRRGGKTATVALARKLLVTAYHVLKSGCPYQAPGVAPGRSWPV